MILWIYGLSGSGKTTLGKKIKEFYPGAIHLDGDVIRKGVNSDLGFSMIDRKENIRRVMEICKLFTHNNMIICSFITPLESIREKIKNDLYNAHLIFLKCSLNECKKRDVKGLYKNKTKQMTGIDSPFDDPEIVDLIVDTEYFTEYESVTKIRKYLNAR